MIDLFSVPEPFLVLNYCKKKRRERRPLRRLSSCYFRPYMEVASVPRRELVKPESAGEMWNQNATAADNNTQTRTHSRHFNERLQPSESSVIHHLRITLGCRVTIYKVSRRRKKPDWLQLCDDGVLSVVSFLHSCTNTHTNLNAEFTG